MRQLLPRRALVLQWADDEQEATAARPGHLRAGGPCGHRRLDRLVDQFVRHAGRQRPLGLPALVEGHAEGVDITLAQAARGLARQVAELRQLRETIPDVRRLLAEDAVGAARGAGEEQQKLVLN